MLSGFVMFWTVFLSFFVVLAFMSKKIIASFVIFCFTVLSFVSFNNVAMASTSESSNFKVASVNLLWNNKDRYYDIKESLSNLDLDAVFIEEHSDKYDFSKIKDVLPYRLDGDASGYDDSEVLLLSKTPFVSIEYIYLSDEMIPVGEVVINGRNTWLAPIHTVAPTSSSRSKRWAYDLAQVDAFIKNHKGDSFIFAGDYNANSGMQPFRELVNSNDLRLVSNSDSTWSPFVDSILKMTQLDNIVVSKDITYKQYRVMQAKGSDHAMLYAELHVR